MRDRLVELILECSTYTPNYEPQARLHAEYLAQHLLNNGVIVPPFPIGTTYYRLVKRNGKCVGEYYIIREAVLNYYNIDKVLIDLGKTVFLTREEAENALKERGGEK